MTTPTEKAQQTLQQGNFNYLDVIKVLARDNPRRFLQIVSECPRNVNPNPNQIHEDQLTTTAMKDMITHLRNGKIVNAIKLVKNETARGLMISKEFVDRYKDAYYNAPK